ncbi:hypothetical protein PIB30_009438 [Stylosanthes scabra]|uniref:RNase H type-1 domain-containing protein n=1 Tax=Stylosanthes scabra TaxID=79078 RepID=A0ABU6X498_9FABA|nr:hypothetical protein [Stylosanthes scabra]
MENSDACPRCNSGPEFIVHCFYFCPKAFQVWQCLGLAALAGNSTSDFLAWIRDKCKRNPSLFAATICWIWRDKNIDVFSPSDPWPAGDCVRGCFSSVHEIVILRCELLAISHGLLLAWDSGYREVICETNSLEAFSLINNDYVSPASDHYDLLLMIKDVLQRNWLACVTLIQRTANAATDYLAKHAALFQPYYREWNEPWADLLVHLRLPNALVTLS